MKGTTWLQEILWQVYNNGEQSTRKIFERVPMLERGTSPDRVDVSTLPSPRLLHTHLTYDVIPKGQTDDTKCKYIYVARNPKDVAVSFYEFTKDFGSVAGYNGPWEFFIRLFVEGKGEKSGQLITTNKSLLTQRCQPTRIQTSWDIPTFA